MSEFDNEYNGSNNVRRVTAVPVQNGERVYCCPRCGTPRKNGGSVFCVNCGARLVSSGGRPSTMTQGSASSPRSRRDNIYSNRRVAGYSSSTQLTSFENKLVWTVGILTMASFIASIYLMDKNVLAAVLCIAIPFIIIFAVIAAILLNPKHKKDLDRNAVRYHGTVKYTRNPFTGEVDDRSELYIDYVNQNTESDDYDEM